MAKERLAIEMALGEVAELEKAGNEPVLTDEVDEQETVIGNFRSNKRLVAMYLLLEMTVRAVHAARASIEQRRAHASWGEPAWDEVKDHVKLATQLETKRDLLHALFFYELQTWLDDWGEGNLGIRKGFDVVRFPRTKSTAALLKELLREGALDE